MMQVHQLSYKAGKKTILNNISFTVQAGKITIVLGPNGAGKSTLLRLLSGELRPTQGSIHLHEHAMNRIPPVQLARQRAVLTQQYAITLPFTCEEVVMMGRYSHFGNQPAAEDRQIALAAMEDMQVTHLRQRPFQTLSGGEQQRVQVARVLAQLWQNNTSAPGKLLLLDEPTSSMDVLHQQMLLTKARQLARQQYAVLIVLHDLNLAAQFADNIVLLQNGELLATGTVQEVLQPAVIYKAYGIEVNLVQHEDYDFPLLVPGRKSSGTQ